MDGLNKKTGEILVAQKKQLNSTLEAEQKNCPRGCECRLRKRLKENILIENQKINVVSIHIF